MKSVGGISNKDKKLHWDIEHGISAYQAIEGQLNPTRQNAPEMGGVQIHYVEVS